MALSDIRSQWGDVFNQVGQKYGLDPDLLLAIAAQENVNPAYNNPLGRSNDTGVHKYGSFDQGTAAIENQAKLLTNPSGPYRDFVKSGSVYDLAKIYSPVGAKNDPYGTNADEPSGILANLAKIKGTDVASLGAQHATSSTAVAGMPVVPTATPDQTGSPTSSYLSALSGLSTSNPQLDRINQLLAAMNLQRRSQSTGDFSADLVRAIGQARAQGQLEWMGIGPPRAQPV